MSSTVAEEGRHGVDPNPRNDESGMRRAVRVQAEHVILRCKSSKRRGYVQKYPYAYGRVRAFRKGYRARHRVGETLRRESHWNTRGAGLSYDDGIRGWSGWDIPGRRHAGKD